MLIIDPVCRTEGPGTRLSRLSGTRARRFLQQGNDRLAENSAEDLACTFAHVAEERKAENVVVLEVGPVAFFTDYFVIATGGNKRQIKAIVEETVRRAKALGCDLLGVEGEAEAGWVLIDLAEVIVHVFTPSTRALYDLELLWGEAPRVEWREREPARPPEESEESA